MDFAQLLRAQSIARKANPWHDAEGKFTSKDHAVEGLPDGFKHVQDFEDKLGVKFRVISKPETSDRGRVFRVMALDDESLAKAEQQVGDRYVARMVLSHSSVSGPTIVESVHTIPSFQRRGIARGLYTAVEKELGYELPPSPSLTEDGKAFRAKKADQPLYIQRKLTPECAKKFIAWAKSQGFDKVLAPEELHTTVVYSKGPVDWKALDVDDTPLIAAGGPRSVEPLGDKGAVVLKFKSERLSARHDAWGRAGATWDYDQYTPHVTITYKHPPDMDLKTIKVFQEPLEFQGELQEPINQDYAEQVVEKLEFVQALKKNPWHDAEGKFTDEAHAGHAGPKLHHLDEHNRQPYFERVVAQRAAARERLSYGSKEVDAYALMRGIARLAGRDPNTKDLLVEDGHGQIVAGISYTKHDTHLYVDALASIKKGEGLKLLNGVLEQAKSLDVPVKLYAIEGAIPFYKSLGFESDPDKLFPNMIWRPGSVKKADIEDVGVLCASPEFSAQMVKKQEFALVLKDGNPYHDAHGQFTTKEKAVEPHRIEHVKGLGWTKNGKGLEGELAARVKALRIPPAWQKVEVHHDPASDLQATGYDSKGRKQYLYSEAHATAAAAEKFARLAAFHGALPKIRKTLNDQMIAGPDDHTAVLRMIDRTGIRIGSDAETGGKHKAYGATTLLGKHIRLNGGQIHLEFEGKHGQKNTRSFYDKHLAAYLAAKNLGPEDRVFRTSDSRVRERMKELAGQDFSPKDFRTWHGTSKALEELKAHPEPTTMAEAKKIRQAVAKKVSEFLSNTPAVALESYIDPKVFDQHFHKVMKSEMMASEYPNEGWEQMEEFVQSVHFVVGPKIAAEDLEVD